MPTAVCLGIVHSYQSVTYLHTHRLVWLSNYTNEDYFAVNGNQYRVTKNQSVDNMLL